MMEKNSLCVKNLLKIAIYKMSQLQLCTVCTPKQTGAAGVALDLQ